MNVSIHNRPFAPGRRFGLCSSILLVTVLAALGLWAPAARAEIPNFCLPGSGAGQCKGARGLATDFETERLYVADVDNNRIDVFDGSPGNVGDFIFAFGWGVATGAPKLEVCTTESSCQAGLAGFGAGQLDHPEWIAVDNNPGSPNRHEIYVADRNKRVSHFKADGSFLNAFGWAVKTGAAEAQVCTTESGCQAGSTGTGKCQQNHFAYVSVGPGGAIFVAASPEEGKNIFTEKIAKWSPAGACLNEFVLWEAQKERLRNLVIDGAEDAYGEGRKYDLETGAVLCELDPGINTAGMALAADGHLFGLQNEDPDIRPGFHRVVAEYEGCELLRRYGYGDIHTLNGGLAVLHGPQGDAFVSEAGNLAEGTVGVNYVKEPPPGPIAIEPSLEREIGNAQTALSLEVNPEGKATTLEVEYVEKAGYEEDKGKGGDGFEGPGTETREVEVPFEEKEGISYHFRALGVEALLGCEPATEEAIEKGECLSPETDYRYRLRATNADGEDELEGGFATKPAIEIVSIFASEVDTTTATINAFVNPLGIPATGYFEYVDDATYQEDTKGGGDGFGEAVKVPALDAEPPQAPLDFGAGKEPSRQKESLFPLAEGTTYHYRVAAIDGLIADYQLSEERTFTTRRAEALPPCANDALRSGPGALLPDCRAYELVSPLDKSNGDIVALTQVFAGMPATLNQSAATGDRLAYGSYRAFGDAKAAPYTSQYLASRDPEAGWLSHGINPPREELINTQVELEFEYHLFSEDLCQGWLVPLNEPPLAAGAEPGHRNLYRRDDQLCGEEHYTAISMGKTERLGALFFVEAQGIAADGKTTAFAANDTLIGSGSPAQPESCKEADTGPCLRRLYAQKEGGKPRYACILPSGAAHVGACSAGTGRAVGFSKSRSSNLLGALSADGSHLYWSASEETAPIYLRLNPAEPESAHELGRAIGTGNLIGPAVASGDVTSGSVTVSNLKTSSGEFSLDQEVEGPGIPAGTTVKGLGGSELKLSNPATATQAGATILGLGSTLVKKVKPESGTFQAGQTVEAANGGIPAGATILSIKEVSATNLELTLSERATVTVKTGVALEASSECTEPDKACTYPVSQDGEGMSGSSASRFWAAAKDGSRAIYITAEDLYAYDAEAKASEKLAGKAKGVLGASEDASRVYFVSGEVLGGPNPEGEAAELNKANLYLAEEGAGEPRFIVTLADADLVAPAGSTTPIGIEPLARNARVSPSGQAVAFMSKAPLTGHDNTDANSGEADTEVYLYDAEAGGGEGELLCASCNPSGARPEGIDLGKPSGFWVAARLGGWHTSLYPGRYLSDDGRRLFFEAQDPLAVRDTNDKLDVYQWERVGKGGCEEALPSYSPEAKGCIGLVSSGKSGRDTALLDASPSGNDVFFATLASLWSPDYGLVDIYDARVDGGFAPPPPPPPSCEGESCQSPPAAPQAPTPSSATYAGPGNLAASAPRCAGPARRAKALTRRAKALRRGARGAKAPVAARKRRAAKRLAHKAGRLARSARRCRARARANRGARR